MSGLEGSGDGERGGVGVWGGDGEVGVWVKWGVLVKGGLDFGVIEVMG